MKQWRKRVLYAMAALLSATVLFDVYARFPASFELAPLQLDAATHSAVLLFHGTGGRNEPTRLALEARARSVLGGRDVAVLRYVWSPYSDNRFRAAVNGERVGRLLGADLARLPALESVHIIAHSAGAYIPGPLCETLKKFAGRPVRVAFGEPTLSDPNDRPTLRLPGPECRGRTPIPAPESDAASGLQVSDKEGAPMASPPHDTPQIKRQRSMRLQYGWR